jgi:undecaprenyl-diphosphatase
LLEAIFLGILQGLTEFLPISSSAHLRIAGIFLPSAADPGATFTAIVQIGTEAAVLLYFRRELMAIFRATLGSLFDRNLANPLARLGWLIVLGSFPIMIAGYLFQDQIRENLRSLWIVSAVLIIFALILYLTDRSSRDDRSLESITPRDGLLAGLAQALALIPGVSRSGATIAMCRLLGFKRVDALKYSFLLAIPAVLASGIYELLQSINQPTLNSFSGSETAIATLVSFLVGYAVITWLIKFVSNRSFAPFVIYRIALGTALIGALSIGLISA